MYSAKKRQFVMWCHLDVSENTAVNTWANYVFRRAGVAVADAPQGPFKPLRALRPNGLESLDINIFVDHWGRSHLQQPEASTGAPNVYIIRACTKNTFLGISKLNDDLTMTEGGIVSKVKAKVEGPVLFRDPINGALYLIASGVHGWEPGRMHVFRAKGSGRRVEGADWEAFSSNPTLHPRSFFSQPTAVLTETDKETGQPYLVYVGDNWVYGPAHSGSNALALSAPMSSSSSAVVAPPSGRFNQKYNAYIGKLLTWEHTRLPFASYVVLPLFFSTTGYDKSDVSLLAELTRDAKEGGGGGGGGAAVARGLPRIEFLPLWDSAAPFRRGAHQSFGCVNGLHKLVGELDGRVACCPRSCSSCSSCSGSSSSDDATGKEECCYAQLASKNKVCRETDQTACILPQMRFSDIISGQERSLGESTSLITHGNHKWKNPGQHMWQLKQKGKDPKFWKKPNARERQRERRQLGDSSSLVRTGNSTTAIAVK